MNITWTTSDADALRILGERLRAVRIAAGYTQQRLAEACRVSLPVIIRMEAGDEGVRIGTWLGALRALGQVQNFEFLVPQIYPEAVEYAGVKIKPRQRALRSDCKKRPGWLRKPLEEESEGAGNE